MEFISNQNSHQLSPNLIFQMVSGFFKDELPKYYVIAFLSHIIHQYGKETNCRLLKIYYSLPDKNLTVIISVNGF